MKTDALDLDADGLPMFRPAADDGLPPIDLATARRLEQEALVPEDLGRAGVRHRSKEGSLLIDQSDRAAQANLQRLLPGEELLP